MKKFEGTTIRQVETCTGKLPDSVGFTRGDGFVRPLTVKELESKKKLGVFVIINNKPFYGL